MAVSLMLGEGRQATDSCVGLIASGSQDTIIDVRPPFGDVSADAKILLLGHTQNVCALDYYNGVLVSGSWDGKARVWKDGETKQVLEGHTAAVWGVLVLESGEIVTGKCPDCPPGDHN